MKTAATQIRAVVETISPTNSPPSNRLNAVSIGLPLNVNGQTATLFRYSLRRRVYFASLRGANAPRERHFRAVLPFQPRACLRFFATHPQRRRAANGHCP